MAEEIEPGWRLFRRDCEIIDAYYIPTRYPSGIPGIAGAETPDRQDAEQAIESAQRALEFVKEMLNS